MKKVKYFFVFTIILFFCMPLIQIQARAIFPDKKALQPPAQDAFPNISNNINFDSEEQLYLQKEDYNTKMVNSEQKVGAQETPEQKRINNELFWFVFLIVLICIFLILFFLMYKKYKSFFQKSN